jgi:hypothetical protein
VRRCTLLVNDAGVRVIFCHCTRYALLAWVRGNAEGRSIDRLSRLDYVYERVKCVYDCRAALGSWVRARNSSPSPHDDRMW